MTGRERWVLDSPISSCPPGAPSQATPKQPGRTLYGAWRQDELGTTGLLTWRSSIRASHMPSWRELGVSSSCSGSPGNEAT